MPRDKNIVHLLQYERPPWCCLMGTLMYGAGHVWVGRAHFYLHNHELSRSPPDESFIDVLKHPSGESLVLDQSFFRPLGMQHFYDSFALVTQICVRKDALTLFGLNDDKLLPDLRITGAGVLRIGLGAHQEHRVNHDAQTADRTKVAAEVLTRLSRLW